MKIFFLLLIIPLAYASEPQCGENQRYSGCGTACPLTCENYRNPPKICPAMCIIGCECEPGYVNTKDGRCVRSEECPNETKPQCGENQRYSGCATPCPLTCENYKNPPKICPAMCIIGCECEHGYVKTKDGRCIRPEECSDQIKPQCGKNQRYSGCGSACPLTCENFRNPPKICPAMCVIGCECKDGYVKTADGRCIRSEQCPEQLEAKRPRQTDPDVCDLPRKAGLCDAYMPRFYFDSSKGECKRFIYGGCGGNGNNFRTLQECQETCL